MSELSGLLVLVPLLVRFIIGQQKGSSLWHTHDTSVKFPALPAPFSASERKALFAGELWIITLKLCSRCTRIRGTQRMYQAGTGRYNVSKLPAANERSTPLET